LELLRKSKQKSCGKSQGAAEKKNEANCTSFSAEFFGFQSVEMVRKTKIQMVTISSRSLTRIHQGLLKSLGL
jgi:hypothetical protein